MLNQNQIEVTKRQLDKFKTAKAEMTIESESANSLNEELRCKVHLDALDSQIKTLERELAELTN